jgi:hypothetical protein
MSIKILIQSATSLWWCSKWSEDYPCTSKQASKPEQPEQRLHETICSILAVKNSQKLHLSTDMSHSHNMPQLRSTQFQKHEDRDNYSKKESELQRMARKKGVWTAAHQCQLICNWKVKVHICHSKTPGHQNTLDRNQHQCHRVQNKTKVTSSCTLLALNGKENIMEYQKMWRR